MIRVGHLIKGLGRGGAEMLLPHLARASKGSVETHVAYCLPWKSALVDPLTQSGATVSCLDANDTFQVLLRVGAARRWIEERQLDVIHCHLPVTGVLGRLAARGVDVPVVYTEHNLQERYRLPTRWLNRATWTLQARAVAVSEEVARSIRRTLSDRVPVDVVRNGIPELPAVPVGEVSPLRESLDLGARPVVGTVAVFRQQKRLDLWLEVADAVRREVPEARFLLVGDGPLRAELERRIRHMELGNHVLLPGLQENIADWLGCMDVFLATSQYEGLPLALLEAMMAERPVVVTEVGGIPEVVRHDTNGYLVPFGATARQAQHVVALLREPGARARLGSAARTTVRNDFGIERMAARLRAIYEEVARTPSSNESPSRTYSPRQR